MEPIQNSTGPGEFRRSGEAFGRLLAALSEPEAGRAADNFVSNEDSFGRVCDDLQQQAPAGSAYLGVGPDQNFSYLARCRPALAFVVDFRRGNALVHLLHKAIMERAEGRVAYLARLMGRDPGPIAGTPSADELVTRFAAAPLDPARLDRSIADAVAGLIAREAIRPDEVDAFATIARRLAGPGMNARFLALAMYPTYGTLVRARTRQGRPAHFLADEASYQAVRQLEQADGVLPVVGDFAGKVTLRAIGDRLRRADLRLGVFYISDVEFFLLRAGRFPAYAANLDALPWHPDAVLIRTSTREIDHRERVLGDSATTILRPVARFLERARAGAIRSDADLFA